MEKESFLLKELPKNGSTIENFNSSDHNASAQLDGELDDAIEGVANKRDTWGGNFEFVLSLIGYSVGLGNLCRFPYICFRNGGGAFLIPFVVLMVVCGGGPLFYLEVNIAQFSGQSIINVWNISPMFKGLGVVMMLTSTVIVWYQAVVFGWVWYYFINSFYPQLGWASCHNDWNTPLCRDNFYGNTTKQTNEMYLTMSGNQTDVTLLNHTIRTIQSGTKRYYTGTEEFFDHRLLHKSTGIDDLGTIQWHVLGCLGLSWLVILACLAKGIRTLGKVVYVTATAPYVLLTILLIRGVTLDGAGEGLAMFLKPDFSKLAGSQVWLEASVQVFYSLGPAWGGIITMASFNKFHHNALRDTLLVCGANMFTAFYGGLVVFSVVGFFSKQTGVPPTELQISGPSLAFIAYPEALSRLPLPQLWSTLFFLTLMFIAIDTIFGTFETVANGIVDMNYRLQKYRMHIGLGLAAVLVVMEIPLCFSGGYYMFVLIDWYIATFNITVNGLLEIVVVCWVYGAARFSRDIEMIRGHQTPLFLRMAWTIFIPFILLFIIIMSIAKYSPPGGKGDYVYPEGALVVGNVVAVGPLLAIVVVAVMHVIREEGTVWQRLKKSSSPNKWWKPNDRATAEIYRMKPYTYDSSWIGRLRVNVLGIGLSRKNTDFNE